MISNIERFDRTVVLVLAELYARFPVRKALDARQFMLTDDGQIAEALSSREEAELDSSDPHFERKQFAFECMHWLVETGYLHGEPKADDGIADAVLTAKGLEVLNATPDSLQETLGERIQAVAKSGLWETGKVLIGQVVGLGVGLVT
ncbi:hypothetical protein H4N55_09665 [Aeromonas veronii]|uniref:hypothetical protein n=1 Tax=Aeromonas TaxID=642 RepID=UPI0013167EA4|nr:hypothetical protein [Aeromonas veronii]MBF3236869.1 hypothetical protein [Aeromonas veronii]QHC09872.1 hypothetical protein GRF56_22145 [Aeromonas veronii]